MLAQPAPACRGVHRAELRGRKRKRGLRPISANLFFCFLQSSHKIVILRACGLFRLLRACSPIQLAVQALFEPPNKAVILSEDASQICRKQRAL